MNAAIRYKFSWKFVYSILYILSCCSYYIERKLQTTKITHLKLIIAIIIIINEGVGTTHRGLKPNVPSCQFDYGMRW